MRYTFDLDHVRHLAHAALRYSGPRRRTFGQSAEDVPPALHLVKDDGVYLMSNGGTHHTGPTGAPAGEYPWVCYAFGAGPDDPWISGDDFVEILTEGDDLRRLALMLPASGTFSVYLTPDTLWAEVSVLTLDRGHDDRDRHDTGGF